MEKDNEFYKAEHNKIIRLLFEKRLEALKNGFSAEAEHFSNCIRALGNTTFGEPKVLTYEQMQAECGECKCESVDYEKGIRLFFEYLDTISKTKNLLIENGISDVDIPIS